MRSELTAPGLRLVEHEFEVPLDHRRPDGEHITVFMREVAASDAPDRPPLLFLQGGPGREAPRPIRNPSEPSWLDRALQEFRVFMLDQRGTGRSSPVGTATDLESAALVERLTHFRADAIVRDAEFVRQALEIEQWSVLGQSFGGMCVVSYLSLAPGGLREAFITGGLPPLGGRIDDVYRATYASTIDASHRYETDPALFTDEHVYPWMFDEYAALTPLRDAARTLAEHEWPRLYDPARLADNAVPVAAAIYADDGYVPRAFSEETAAHIRGLRPWITNELNHDGVRVDGERVLGRLIDLARGHL